MAELKPEAKSKDIYDMTIYYFIGRVNPPHQGHIHTMQNMINDANANGTIGIILLGSGDYGGEISMANPITHGLKEDFLRRTLHGDYIIKPMKNNAPALLKEQYDIRVKPNVKTVLFLSLMISSAK